jgi:hypothetical protein
MQKLFYGCDGWNLFIVLILYLKCLKIWKIIILSYIVININVMLINVIDFFSKRLLTVYFQSQHVNRQHISLEVYVRTIEFPNMF